MVRNPVSNRVKKNMSVKQTFASVYAGQRVSVSDRVKEFSKMNECLISSGYCNLHNVRVRREVRMKKMSTRDKDGEIKWVLGEVTVLVHPSATKPNEIISETDDTMTLLSEAGTANKRTWFICDDEMSQSVEGNPV